MFSRTSFVLVILFLGISTTFSLDILGKTPEQIHIAYGDTPDEMVISWATSRFDNGDSSYVYYSTDNSLSNSLTAETVYWSYGNELGCKYFHTVTISGLTPSQLYNYQVETGTHKSEVFSFTAMPSGSDYVAKFLVFGDMGKFGTPQALPSLIKQVESGYPIASIHVGDFAYDLDSLGGAQGDNFMRQIQPMATTVPYMTAVGNHEDNWNYSHYINRFRMPHWEKTGNMWYSWNIHQVHFIAYSTETVFYQNENFTTTDQLAWLEQDLILANENRASQPWIIAYGHRPMYCSNTDHDDCTLYNGLTRQTFEDLFNRYGVDIILEAHEHSYERLWPVFNQTVTQFNYSNPMAPVHLISGAAGCNEDLGVCINPIKEALGPWSAFRSAGILTYGYARMEVYNATHIYFEELRALEGDKILDSVWIVQENHGPFSSSNSSSSSLF